MMCLHYCHISKVSHRVSYLHLLVQDPNIKHLQMMIKEKQLFGSFVVPLFEGGSAQILSCFC